MNGPLVSILVPVYRVEQYIERCARSVFRQTYQNVEYIFVDDASDDSSIDILNRIILDYPNRSEKVVIIRHNKNKGLAAARNTAIEACHGDFVFHVDSDDWVETNAIELLVRKHLETGADIVSGEALDDANGIKTKHLSSGWNLDKKTLLIHLLTYKVSTTLWRRLIRKSLYTDYNIFFDERGSGGEDFQVFPRLVYYANKISGINDIIYYYNKSNQLSISNNVKNNIDFQIQGLISVKRIVSFFSDKEPYLRNLVAGMDVRNIHFRMIYNVNNKNKKGYKQFLKYMKESDSSYWKQVQWDKNLIRYAESNYYSMMLLLLYRKLLNKTRKLTKKVYDKTFYCFRTSKAVINA